MRSAICPALGPCGFAAGVTEAPISASLRTRTAAPIFIAGNLPARTALRTVETEIDLAFAYSATVT